MEIAVNRPPTKLRFPQGSEVWITGCPKFGTAVKSGRTNPELEAGDGAARASAMARGFRLSSELVAGVVVGAVIGWGFDRLLSTSPWGLIVFFLLGFVAGVINVMQIGRRGSGQNRPLTERKAGRTDCRAPAWPAVPRDAARMMRSDPPVQHRQDLHDRPYRQSGDRFHQFVGLHVHLGGSDFAADDRRRPAARPGPYPVGGRNQLRIRGQHDHEAAPARKA